MNVSNASTQFEGGDILEQNIAEEAVLTIFPEVSPQKDDTYRPSRSESFSDDSLSEVEVEEEKPNLTYPQDDTKFIVFKEELFKLFKRCPECGAPVIKKHQSTQGTQFNICDTNMYE